MFEGDFLGTLVEDSGEGPNFAEEDLEEVGFDERRIFCRMGMGRGQGEDGWRGILFKIHEFWWGGGINVFELNFGRTVVQALAWFGKRKHKIQNAKQLERN